MLYKQSLRITVGFQTVDAPLAADATLLMAPKRCIWLKSQVLVDPDASDVQPLANANSTVHILGPNRRSQAHVRVVCARNDFIIVRPLQKGYNWPKRLFCNNHTVIRRAINHSRLDEIPISLAMNRLSPSRYFLPLVPNVIEERVHTIILKLVLHRPDENILLDAATNLEVFDTCNESVAERGVDVLVDEYPFHCNTYLTTVQE